VVPVLEDIMNGARNIILVALAFAIACGAAGVFILVRREAQEVAPATAKVVRHQQSARNTDEPSPPPPPNDPRPAVAEVSAAPAVSAAPQSTPSVTQPKGDAKAPSATRQAGPGGTSRRGPFQDPMARVALGLVGMDPTAEAYWYAAINDPKIPAKERQDLIEDLNEDGLSDPKHPGPVDLPVILNRIGYIEAIGPYAMDQVNADAFAEAYKDLVNLANVALGGGEPVR
jgi:hypothetical protein